MKNYTYQLIEQEPDGRSGEVRTTPVAILGGDDKSEIYRLAIRTLAKHLAQGDYARIAGIEDDFRPEVRTLIREFLCADEDALIIELDGRLFLLRRLDMDRWPRSLTRRYRDMVLANDETGDYRYVKHSFL